jgi:hypothetical protein
MMENLLPRQIKVAEAARLGIKHGWYGIKVNGTLMTEGFPDLEACERQIKKLNPAPVGKKSNASANE